MLQDLLLLAQADEVVEEEFLPLMMIPCRMCRVAMVLEGQGVCGECGSKPMVSSANYYASPLGGVVAAAFGGPACPTVEYKLKHNPALAPTTYNPYIPPRVKYQQYLKQAYQEIEEWLA